MSYIIIFLIVVSIAAFLAKVFNKKIDITIPISVMLIVLIIYPFGFFNRLDIGVYVVEFVATVSLIYLIYRFIKSIINKKVLDFFRNLFTPALVVYILFYIYFIYINRNRLFSSWDEFSHWGTIVKNMFYFNSYGTNPETIVAFRGYPPFTAIFEYFAQKIVNSYSEGRIIIAMNLLYISMVLPIFRNIEWKKDLSKLLIYVPIIFILPLCMYSSFYTTIYVDAMLGIFMAYILYIYFTMEEGMVKYISICLALISLPLIKAAGAGLAIFVLIIILIDIIYQYKKFKDDKKIFHKKLLFLVIYIICFVIGKYSWDIHLLFTNTTEAWDTDNLSIANIVSLVTGNGAEYQYTVIKNFIKQFFLEPISINIGELTNFTILLIFILYSAYTAYLVRKKQGDIVYRRYMLANIILIICYAIYMISLLVLYLFTYSEYEAVNLASYSRYSYIFLVGMYAYNTLIILENFSGIKKDKTNFVILIVVLFSVLPINTIIDLSVRSKASLQNSITIRNEYSKIQKYKSILEENDIVYYISCGSKGYDYHISRYELVPNELVATDGWSLGTQRYEGDIWTKNISVEDLKTNFINSNITYVYIFEADSVFKEMYSELFKSEENIKNETMYKVELTEDDLKLVEVY